MKEHKIRKRFLALAMCLCMIFTMMPLSAHATESEHIHSWSDAWSTNTMDHWHDCNGEGICDITEIIYKSGYGTHSYDNDFTCTVCGYTCSHTYAGYNSDNSSHWQECAYSCGFTTASESHDQNGENGSCSVCYYAPNSSTDPDEHTHEWGDWSSNNNGTHTRTCITDASHTETADCAAYAVAPVDGQNHNILCECMYVLGTEAHTMSAWYQDGEVERRDCTANCDYFEERSIETHTHSYTAVVTEPTCIAQGYTTYTCSCNDSYVSDYVDALGHDWGDYESDGNGYHTRTCTTDSSHYQTEECGGGTATCTEPATCSDCGATYGSLNSTNHSGGTELRDVKVATETEDGYTGDTYCLGCNVLIAEGSIIYATGSGDDDDDDHTHNYSYYKYDGTNHWKMCICGQGQAGSVKPHSLVLEGNNNGHWQECTVCNYYSDAQAHIYSNDSDEICNDCGYNRHVHSYSTATCAAPATCSCGIANGFTDPNNHTGGTEVRNAVEATIIAEGYTGDTYCLGCGSKIASGEVIPKAGVIFDGPGMEDVTFIPAEGVELPEDAEIIVNPHTPSADELAFLLLPETAKPSTRMAVVPEDIIKSTDAAVIGPDGERYIQHEKLLINGKEYYVSGSDDGASLLLYDKAGNMYSYDGEKEPQEIGKNAGTEYPENKFISINGAVYQIHSVQRDADGSGTLILYLDGKPAGMCQFDQYEEMDSINIYNDDYHPAKVRERQQLNNYLGTVTPGESPVDGLESGKTYNVSVIGSNDIHLEGAENVSGTVTQTFDIPNELVGKTDVTFVAVHNTNPHATALAAAKYRMEEARAVYWDYHGDSAEERQRLYEAANRASKEWSIVQKLYDAWEKEHAADTGTGNELGIVTISENGKTLTATYAVSSFSPFTVYAFVEADEPEIKTLSATIVDGSDDTTEAPDTTEPVVSPQTSDSWIWYVLIAVVAGAIAVVSVVYGKRRKRKVN